MSNNAPDKDAPAGAWTESSGPFVASDTTLTSPPPMPAMPLEIGYASAVHVPYASARTLARWTIGWFWAAAATQVLLMWPAVMALVMRRRYMLGEDASVDHRLMLAAGGVESVNGIVALVGWILWLVWVHRAYRNLRPLGAEGLRFSPGWAVAYYFIPFVHLVRPFQVMRETWRASDPRHEGGTSWRHGPSPTLVNAWWITFVLAVAVAIVWTVFEFNEDDARSLFIASVINVFVVLLDLVMFTMQIEIARRVTLMQDERAGRFGTAPSAW